MLLTYLESIVTHIFTVSSRNVPLPCYETRKKASQPCEKVFCDRQSPVFHTSNGPVVRDRPQPVRLSTVIPTVTCASLKTLAGLL